ncbi:cell division cycle-associated protein 3 [Salmo salar]|uniref:Cell division cycle-associated protein 3-like n=1 Tax=Salmo salar TaxID=8030 RepID=A0A1S3P5V6_SALSA|nr:cell division cycle-associated protein 3-like [Salmo salar]XP_014022990.1 cell division cycle-associated protein 3-like [Salmo salar]|eukprot:XP_014022986.1 PREDICTED: cell division cycle-associated protein 3-like [Salmo salar]
MGSSESKVAVASTPKHDHSHRIKHDRLSQLVDPRSPSVAIDRTPIQVGGTVSCVPVVVESDCSILASDPRSSSVGVTRTPMKDSTRVTVGSFARCLDMLLHGDSVELVAPVPFNKFPNLNVEEAVVEEELGSSEPVLSPQPSQVSGDMIQPSPQSVTSHTLLIQSPFVLVGEAQIEVKADFTLEEAEEAEESSLHKRLSMSLITCQDGVTPSPTFAEVHYDSPASRLPENAAAELHKDEPDHAYALPSFTSDPAQPLTPMAEPSIPTVTDFTEVTVATEMPKVEVPTPVEEPVMPVKQESPVVPSTTTTGPSVSQQQPQATGIRCPTFDTKSPSQMVFKPQWLGKGFGATGVRARGRGGKGGLSTSPLSVQVGNKNAPNENKGQSVKPKQRDKALMAEGRSPLQMLKETNSPREQATQMKLKVSTPDRQRLGQMDRGVLTVSMDKENR